MIFAKLMCMRRFICVFRASAPCCHEGCGCPWGLNANAFSFIRADRCIKRFRPISIGVYHIQFLGWVFDVIA